MPVNLLRICLALVAVFVFGGATACRKTTIELTILHTNDMHMYLKPGYDRSQLNPYGLGGIARLKTLIDRIRATKPNTILLDAGDWSEATMYYAADAGSSMLRIMNALGYDATVVGNHDYLIGPSELANTIERGTPAFPILMANKNLTRLDEAEQSRLEKLLPSYVMLNKGQGANRLRVSVIGLTNDEIFYTSYFKPARVGNPERVAFTLARDMYLQNRADVVVLLSHNNFERHKLWAKALPWVTVIISGHAHKIRLEEVKRPLQNAYIAEAGHGGMYLGEMTLSVTLPTKQVKLKNYKLHPISEELPEDPGVAALVAEHDELLKNRFGHDVVTDRVAHCHDDMPHVESGEGVLNNLVADAYREALGTEMSLEVGSLIGIGLAPGNVSTMDVFNIAPHIWGPKPGQPFPDQGKTWTLKRAYFRGSLLRLVLNALVAGDTYDLPIGGTAISGARVRTGRDAAGLWFSDISILDPASGLYEPLIDDREYSVAIHDGLELAMEMLTSILEEERKIWLPRPRVEESGIEAWRAVLAVIGKKPDLRAADYDVGQRIRTKGGDLGVFPHFVQVVQTPEGTALRTTVRNLGLSPTGESNALSVSVRGAGEGWDKLVSSAPLPSLQPGREYAVETPWESDGLTEVLVQIEGKDANPNNNTLSLVRKTPEFRESAERSQPKSDTRSGSYPAISEIRP